MSVRLVVLAVCVVVSLARAEGGSDPRGPASETAPAASEALNATKAPSPVALEAPRPAPRVGHREEPHHAPVAQAALAARVTSPAANISFGPYTSVQVNVDPFGENIVGDAANEPSLVIDPNDPMVMAIGWRHFDSIASNFRQAGIGYSADGGQTWTFPDVLDRGQFRSDPVLSSDGDGVFYYSSLSSLSSIEVFRSFDGGATWGLPVPAYGGDKQWIAVDKTAGIGAGHFYQIWNVQFTCCDPFDVTRSVDTGVSFEGPYVGPLPSMKWGTMDIGSDGTLYLAGVTLGGTSHLFSLSTDARNAAVVPPTFSPSQSINLGGTTAIQAAPNPAGLLGQVWIKVDNSGGATDGNLYVLGSVDPPGDDPLDVMLIRSTDGGATWSDPVRVNDDPPVATSFQWFGSMSVAPNGRIDVIFNDTRASADPRISSMYYTFSMDAGQTWSANVPVTPEFDSYLGWPQQNKLGDYYEVVSDVDGANVAYAATFNGEQDVYFLRIPADCNDNGFSDADDITSGRSDDCDANGIPDDCQLDCNGNAIADVCDVASGTSEDCNSNGVPDECDIGFGCHSIEFGGGGAGCLDVLIELDGQNEEGDVFVTPPATNDVLVSEPYANGQLPPAVDISTLADGDYRLCVSATEALPGAPDLIVFEALNTSCGPGGVFEFFLNGVSMGTVDADPVDSCSCGAPVQSFAVTDAGLLSHWVVGGSNFLGVSMTGGSENLAWVRARIASGGLEGIVCIFDTGSDCTSDSLCSHAYVGSPVNATATAEFETRVACKGFAKSGETTIAIAPTFCDCPIVAGPVAESTPTAKNRFLTFAGGNPGLQTAVRVTAISLPPPFDALDGKSFWVGPPSEVSELGALNDATPPTFRVAGLQCSTVFEHWASHGDVHVYDPVIVPGGRYEIQEISTLCSPSNEAAFSPPLSVGTGTWGDAVGPFDGGSLTWTAPDGNVDVATDAVAALDRFSSLPTAPPKARVDMEPATLDLLINITDVTEILDAFTGAGYPFAVPAPCP